MTIPRCCLSVVCPALNEEEVLPLFHRELSRVLDTLGPNVESEIIYVDDGSRDLTLPVIQGLAEQDPRVRFLSFTRNFGKEAALTAGLQHSRGDVVITLDSDLQHPPALIPELLARWAEGYDVVLTRRHDADQIAASKRWTSRAFHAVHRWLSDTSVPHGRSDYRLLTRRAVAALMQMHETHRFLRAMVQWLGFPTVEVPFQVERRPAGATKYHFTNLLRLAADGIFSFSRVPLRLIAYLGLGVVFLSLLMSTILVARWLVAADAPITGWHYLLVSSHFLGGCILLGLGVVGEYVGRIYEQVKQRPLFVLKRSSWATGEWEFPEPREQAPVKVSEKRAA